jgi:hypothetical protein
MSMRSHLVVLACSLLSLCAISCVVPGNTTMETGVQPAMSDADRQLALASSFVQGGDFKRALHIYTMVSDENPLSPAGATATQMAAFIMTSLRNPSRSDTMAAVWFRKALARTRNADQRLQAEVSLALLDRLTLQTSEMQRHRSVVDSLQRVIRRQSGTILSQTRRLSDMEREVIAAKSQMQRLKELDENLSRTRSSR